MGEKPHRDFTIERIDVNEGYSPDNCEWIHKNRQSRNRKYTTLYRFEGKELTLGEIGKILGKSYDILCYHLVRMGRDGYLGIYRIEEDIEEAS